jgi:translation elongation factor EF-1alpha
MAFVPTSGLEGANILKKSAIEVSIAHGIAGWFVQDQVPCLLTSIENLMIVMPFSLS